MKFKSKNYIFLSGLILVIGYLVSVTYLNIIEGSKDYLLYYNYFSLPDFWHLEELSKFLSFCIIPVLFLTFFTVYEPAKFIEDGKPKASILSILMVLIALGLSIAVLVLGYYHNFTNKLKAENLQIVLNGLYTVFLTIFMSIQLYVINSKFEQNKLQKVLNFSLPTFGIFTVYDFIWYLEDFYFVSFDILRESIMETLYLVSFNLAVIFGIITGICLMKASKRL